MILQVINRNDPEKVFGTFSFTAAMAKDDAACLDLVTSVNGVNVVTPASVNLGVMVGVVDAAQAAGSIGLVQMFGYRASSKILTSTDSRPAGAKVVPANAVTYLTYSAAGDGVSAYVVTMESVAATTASSTVSKKIFLRCL